jgi:antirestriction protein ArdC
MRPRLLRDYYADLSGNEPVDHARPEQPRGIILDAALCVLCRHRHNIHSTGHETRLNRTFGAHFGDELYSIEELVAEMGAAFLCAIAGIANENTERNTTAYLQNWVSKLEEDNRLIVHAAANAQRAVDSIVGTAFENGDESIDMPAGIVAPGTSQAEDLAA